MPQMVTEDIANLLGADLTEDLRKWLRQRWVDISRKKKGGGHPPCGASAGSKARAGGKRAYPKCVPASKASGMSKKEKASAVRRKRSNYKGKGSPPKKAIHVRTKTNEGKKDACYNKVKSRYKVWPSAYGSLALSKCRKVGAANWGNKSENKTDLEMNTTAELKELIRNLVLQEMGHYSEPDDFEDDLSDNPEWSYDDYFDTGDGLDWDDTMDWDDDEEEFEDDHEGSMAKADLGAIAQLASEINNMLDEDEELEGWVQAKITLAADYIEAVHRYMKYDE